MGTFAKGDVIIASLSYSDFSGGKRRPALIVAAPAGLDPVLCLITSKARGDGFDVHITKADFVREGMSQATITKSVRLSPIESEELLWLSEKRAMSEAALMKKWISEGIQAEKLEMAIQAYIRQQVDLRSGAIMAGVSYNRFMREVQSRNIVILEDEQFLEGLLSLADAFDTPELRQAVEKVITKIACQNFSATPDLQN